MEPDLLATASGRFVLALHIGFIFSIIEGSKTVVEQYVKSITPKASPVPATSHGTEQLHTVELNPGSPLLSWLLNKKTNTLIEATNFPIPWNLLMKGLWCQLTHLKDREFKRNTIHRAKI
jgi:hypothetical protein